MLRFLSFLLSAVVLAAGVGAGVVALAFYHFGRDLPDYRQLADYEPPVTTRLYAGDGRLMAEYAVEKRVFVPVGAMPKVIVDAFVSAEDKNFFQHGGVDVVGVVRAAITNINNLGTERRLVGASTITQQVVKNFLLTNELSLERKIKEAILAFRINNAFTKERILELYLNEIYLGYGSYGVAAAALNYFNKSLDELTIAEAAFLAALPKGPNNYDPVRKPAAAEARRNWVIGRMLEDGHITTSDAEQARAQPLEVRQRDKTDIVVAEYFAEEVRRELIARYGEKALYEGGLAVRASVDPRLQAIAEATLRQGLEAYDRRHGWRGPVARLDGLSVGRDGGWKAHLAAVQPPPGIGSWQLAVVLKVDDRGCDLGFSDGSRGRLPFAEMTWARPWLAGQRVGAPPRRPADVVAAGDVVLVEALQPGSAGASSPARTFGLRQLPAVDGALVALDPHTGRVLAMAGGYAYGRSEFNRATQALRQPGSAFKPFVYLAALEADMTPSSMVLDAPFTASQGPGLPNWTPSNYSNDFLGLATLRVGIEQSRNLMTVRLADQIGMDRVVTTAEQFGIYDRMPPYLAFALGAGETTVLRLTAAYAMLVNGGKKITPTLIDRVQDRHGRTVFRHDQRPCPGCRGIGWVRGEGMPEIPDTREAVTDPTSAYQMVTMLQGVVERGTGKRVKEVGKPLAGKTGTSNEARDTWFVGFSPDLAVGVFVGFDEPTPLGPGETGGLAASPIFRDFMAEALKDEAAVPFRVPPGVRLVRVNATSGLPTGVGDKRAVLEPFKPGTEPGAEGRKLGNPDTASGGPATGTGGLY